MNSAARTTLTLAAFIGSATVVAATAQWASSVVRVLLANRDLERKYIQTPVHRVRPGPRPLDADIDGIDEPGDVEGHGQDVIIMRVGESYHGMIMSTAASFIRIGTVSGGCQ